MEHCGKSMLGCRTCGSKKDISWKALKENPVQNCSNCGTKMHVMVAVLNRGVLPTAA